MGWRLNRLKGSVGNISNLEGLVSSAEGSYTANDVAPDQENGTLGYMKPSFEYNDKVTISFKKKSDGSYDIPTLGKLIQNTGKELNPWGRNIKAEMGEVKYEDGKAIVTATYTLKGNTANETSSIPRQGPRERKVTVEFKVPYTWEGDQLTWGAQADMKLKYEAVDNIHKSLFKADYNRLFNGLVRTKQSFGDKNMFQNLQAWYDNKPSYWTRFKTWVSDGYNNLMTFPAPQPAPAGNGGGNPAPTDNGGDDTSGDDTSGDDTSGDDTSGDDTSNQRDPMASINADLATIRAALDDNPDALSAVQRMVSYANQLSARAQQGPQNAPEGYA